MQVSVVMFTVGCFMLSVGCADAESGLLDETIEVVKKRVWSLRSGMDSNLSIISGYILSS